jgi:retron-type reverse transcriptase
VYSFGRQSTGNGMSCVNKAKPFAIPKREVWEAFKRVKANRGAAGVDGLSIQDFEAQLAGNLYKLWNRMSSGSYMPPPVRRVEIPKANGGTRPLGIPTVADRVAQEVVRRYLEPVLEPLFHADSYGYRPRRSAIDAVRTARQRCWRHDWVVDIDIKGFFDNIDHGLLLKAVRKHTKCPWVLLYIERWLKAPAMLEDGQLVSREKGTPQGGVVTPRTQKVTCLLGGSRRGRVRRLRIVGTRTDLWDGERVADGKTVCIDKNFFDQQSQDLLAFVNVYSFCPCTELPSKPIQALCKLHISNLVYCCRLE